MRRAIVNRVSGLTWKMNNVDFDPVRRITFYFALAFLFARFSFLAESVSAIFKISLYMNYWTAIPAIIGLFLCGGIARAVSYRAAIFQILFVVWMGLAVPTSYWPGASFGRTMVYLQYELPLLFLLGGLAVNWDDAKKIMTTLAWSGIPVLILVRALGKMEQSRMTLDFGGSISNSNDLAMHLLLLIPFFLYLVIDSKRFFAVRILFFLAILYSLYVIVGTASRGGLVAIGLGLIFVMIYASNPQRLAFLVLVPALAVGTMVLLPDRTMNRLGALVGKEDVEAAESGSSRRYLFQQSLIFTLRRPIFGVGPDQFANFEGSTRIKEGLIGNWHATHCSWTQVSSECGIPALIFYVGAVFLTFSRVKKAYSLARRNGWKEQSNACFCFLLAMVLFYGSITFLSSAYTYRQPAFIAIGFVLALAIERIAAAQNTQTPALKLA